MHTTTFKANKAIVRQYLEEAWTKGNDVFFGERRCFAQKGGFELFDEGFGLLQEVSLSFNRSS